MATVYTQGDLIQVTAAIMALATGQRAITVSYAGPPARSVTYGIAQLGELRALQAEIARDINGAPTFRRVSFNKGFGPSNSGSGIAG